MTSAQEAVLKAKALAAGKPSTDPVEVVKDRTAMTRTLVDPATGNRTTQLRSDAINYKDAKGAWQPIDDTLKANGNGPGWANGANAYQLSLPTDLSAPVKVADSKNAGTFVSMQLAPAATPVAALKPVPGVSKTRFDTLLDAIPVDAQIATAQLNMYVINDTAYSASSVDVRALTRSFTTAATWGTRDGSTAWGTAAGIGPRPSTNAPR